ncbi:MAG: hypothetical protein GTO08_07435 [Deltaproteobacteria bacterium]|nr:hypothetical protein [Deltaproteobacteria bacterium]
MAVYHGKSASLYAWNGTSTSHSSEACTENGTQAQITDAAKRILDPNETQTFTDSGGKNVINVDYVQGIAYFDGTVAVVTATGKHVLAANITEVGNLTGWSIETNVELVEANVFGDTWKKSEAGMLKWNGGAEGFFLNNFWFDAQDELKMWFVRFRLTASIYLHGWCHIPSVGRGAPIGELVNKSVTIDGWKHMIAVVP